MWKFESYKASWIESFELLKWDSLKLLLLVSLRSLGSLYSSFLRAWFLPLALLVGLVLNWPRLVGAFYITFLVRAARPSIDLKNKDYWQQTVFADWILFFGVLLMVYIPRLWSGQDLPSPFLKVVWYIYDFVLRLFFLAGQVWLPGTELLGSSLVFLSPFIVVWILFMLDAKKEVWAYIKALGRAVLMLAYNYPFFLITYAVLRLAIAAGYMLSVPVSRYGILIPEIGVIPLVPLVGWIILLLVIIPYWVCVITNFYVKRLHEQFSLYYSK